MAILRTNINLVLAYPDDCKLAEMDENEIKRLIIGMVNQDLHRTGLLLPIN